MQGYKKQIGWCYKPNMASTRPEHGVPRPGIVTSSSWPAPSNAWASFPWRNPSSCPTWTSLANALRRFEVQKQGWPRCRQRAPEPAELQGWAVSPSRFHIPTSTHTTDFDRLGFPQQLLQRRISCPLLKGKKWIMESLYVHLLEMSHAD